MSRHRTPPARHRQRAMALFAFAAVCLAGAVLVLRLEGGPLVADDEWSVAPVQPSPSLISCPAGLVPYFGATRQVCTMPIRP